MIINLTPHAICLFNEDGLSRIIDKKGPPARVTFVPGGDDIVSIDGMPVHPAPRFSAIENLPPPLPDTLYVVSQIVALVVAAVMPERHDVVYPGTSGAKRSRTGVVAVTHLIRAV